MGTGDKGEQGWLLSASRVYGLVSTVEEQTEDEKQPQNSSQWRGEACFDLEHMISRGGSEGTAGSLEPVLTVWSFWTPTQGHQRSPNWHLCPVLTPCLGAVSCISPVPSIPGTPASFPGQCLWLHHGGAREVLRSLL